MSRFSKIQVNITQIDTLSSGFVTSNISLSYLSQNNFNCLELIVLHFTQARIDFLQYLTKENKLIRL